MSEEEEEEEGWMCPSDMRIALCGRSKRERIRGMGTGSMMMGVSSMGVSGDVLG
jgi:hypothetical protein